MYNIVIQAYAEASGGCATFASSGGCKTYNHPYHSWKWALVMPLALFGTATLATVGVAEPCAVCLRKRVDGWSADLTKAQTAASELASKLVAMRGGGAAPKAEDEPAAPSSQGLIDVPTPSGVSNPLRTTAEV